MTKNYNYSPSLRSVSFAVHLACSSPSQAGKLPPPELLLVQIYGSLQDSPSCRMWSTVPKEYLRHSFCSSFSFYNTSLLQLELQLVPIERSCTCCITIYRVHTCRCGIVFEKSRDITEEEEEDVDVVYIQTSKISSLLSIMYLRRDERFSREVG